MQQHPKHLPESVYLAGKSFVMGVALGISGVVASPVRGKQTYQASSPAPSEVNKQIRREMLLFFCYQACGKRVWRDSSRASARVCWDC